MKILKDLRNNRKISQEKLAKHMGVSRSTIAMWESGASEPDNESLKKLSMFFGVSTDYLLENEISNNEPQISDDDIMFALFDGDKDITPEMFDEVKQFARFVREKHKNK